MSLLRDLNKLESLYEKKKRIDITNSKKIIKKQLKLINKILNKDRIEKGIMKDIIDNFHEEDIKLTKKEKRNISKEKLTISKLETNFYTEIYQIKKKLNEIIKFYNEQKKLKFTSYNDSLENEKIQINQIKDIMTQIFKSEVKIKNILSEITKKIKGSKENYEYEGLIVPYNIQLLSQIFKNDLGPFLKAYQKYKFLLKDIIIKLKYSSMTKDLYRSQYTAKSIFKNNKKKRIYIMYISNNKNPKKGFVSDNFTFEEKYGWCGHELAHMLQYNNMSPRQIMGFTMAYAFWFGVSKTPLIKKTANWYLSKIERKTDAIAIRMGFGLELSKGSRRVFYQNGIPKDIAHRYKPIYTETHELIDQTSERYFKKNSPRK